MTARFHAILTDYYERMMGLSHEDASHVADVILATLQRSRERKEMS